MTGHSPLLLSLKVAGISTFFVFIFGVFFARYLAQKVFWEKHYRIIIHASACIAADCRWFWVGYFIREEWFYW